MKSLLLALAAGLALAAPPVRADDPAVPGAGFPASRYEALWTKSPFAVATSEVVAESSPDYFLVGIANIEGVSYASVVEKQTPQEHFLISTDKPVKGLTLSSITVGHNGSDTLVVVKKDGQLITLKLEQMPETAAVPGMPLLPPGSVPGTMTPQITMPGVGISLPGAGSTRPPIPPRIHRSTIYLPAQQQQPAPTPPPPPK